jgi:thiamine-phosphate pyrophosphorylase
MIDANRNRASEGLRVAEDYCRFALGDQHLTRLIKNLRHDLAAALAPLDSSELLAARDTEADVGTTVSTAAEQSRQSLDEIAFAAWPRTQQALRVIEECLKLVAPQAAPHVEALRYRSYTLAKGCQLTAVGQRRLADARLYVLIDGPRPNVPWSSACNRSLPRGSM